MGGKKTQEMGGKKQLNFVCYADDATRRGETPKFRVFCRLFLDIFMGYFFSSQYTAEKIIRLRFFAFPRRITHMLTGCGREFETNLK